MTGQVADLLFEAKFLKEIPRSGFQFLGAGKESVAEHSFMTVFIAFVLSTMEPEIDARKLVAMCIVHDLPESRIGDLNNVQKAYVKANETRALEDLGGTSSLKAGIAGLLSEFNAGTSPEARLAKDADQLGLILELKDLIDKGYAPAHKWLPYVLDRLQTGSGRQIADEILATERDRWWMKNYLDSPESSL